MGWVQGLARTLLRDPNAAEDVAQETLLVAMERPPREALAGPGLRRWLASVTRTLARQLVRGERRRARRERVVADGRAQARQVVERGAMQQRMGELVMGLDEPYRSTILLRYLDGLNSREIAERQGVSPAAIRKRLSRGIDRLRGRLDEEYEGDRCAWLMALLPLARTPGGVAGSTSVLSGALWMSTQAKIAIALILIAIGVVALRASTTSGTGAGPPDELVGPTPSGSTATPPSPISSTGAQKDGGDRAAAALPDAGSAATRVAGAITLRAQVLGSDDRPLPGARWVAFGEAVEPIETDGEGRIELRLDADAQEQIVEAVATDVHQDGEAWLGFIVRAPGYTTRELFEPLDGPAIRELGTLRLVPVGAVAGVVVDAQGQPFAGARVVAGPPEPYGRDPETLELWGILSGPEWTYTDERGEFALTSLPEGRWCVWVGAPGHFWARSEVLAIDPTTEQPWLELELRELPLGNRISGVVHRPDGTPFEGAWITCADPEEEELDFGEFGYSAADGSFLLPVPTESEWYVRAMDLHWEFGCVTLAERVAAGTAGLVLTLRGPQPLRISVEDEEGEPVTSFSVWITPQGETFPAVLRRIEDVDGLAAVPTPDWPYLVFVRAKGYARLELGPFPPGPDRELACTLERLTHVRGRLLAAGEPVANGRVQLIRSGDPRRVDWLQGFPSRLDGSDLAGVMTGPDGRFELPIKRSGPHVLFAEADGWAAVEHGPLELDRGREERIDVVLTAGGAIEGFVRTPPGMGAAGIVVRFSRGDMRVHEARTDAEGRYRQDGLTPGGWMVRATPNPSAGGPRPMMSAIETREYEVDYAFPWDCEVFEGRTTQLDLDLTGYARAGLRGSLTLDGEPGAGFSACLTAADVPWFTKRLGKEFESLDAQGHFEFDDDREVGEYWLILYSSDDLYFVSRLTLEPGENTFDLARQTTNVTAQIGEGVVGRPLCIVSQLTPDLFAIAPLKGDGAGTYRHERVPVGRCALHARGEGDEPDDPTSWPSVYQLELSAGEGEEITVE